MKNGDDFFENQETFTDEDFHLYCLLADSKNYLHESELECGCLYYINARNAHLGIWIPGKRGFIISRFKFKANYLFVEYHYDIGTPYGTVKPFYKIDRTPYTEEQMHSFEGDKISFYENQLSENVLNYLNQKAEDFPFSWIKDKVLL